ncbi:MAG: response regulator, partial [Betaproteobacteria bacterium]
LREVAAGLQLDAVVLDLMLPGSDGLQVCQRLRASSSVPVLMLTARGELVDRVLGLQLGADDYRVKPFEPRELVARLQALLRRAGSAGGAPAVAPGTSPRAARFGPWRLDFERRELAASDGPVPLGGGEYKLLPSCWSGRAAWSAATRCSMRSTAARPAPTTAMWTCW